MQCSTEKFLASQALYGIMIAYPGMSEDNQIIKAKRIAAKMMSKTDKTNRLYKRKVPITYAK